MSVKIKLHSFIFLYINKLDKVYYKEKDITATFMCKTDYEEDAKLLQENLAKAYGFDPYYYKDPNYKPDKGFAEWLQKMSNLIKEDIRNALAEYTKINIQDMTPEQKEEFKRKLYNDKHIANIQHNNPLVAIWFEDLCKIIDEVNND